LSIVTLTHFERAAADIAAHGDNDTLPFDPDNRFISDSQNKLAEIAFRYCHELEKGNRKSAKHAIEGLAVFSERLLVPAGAAGFRTTTKIHPFWNLYFNGLGVAIAEALEPIRNERARSYRFLPAGNTLFDRDASWRAFREATIRDCETQPATAMVVQPDISSFYEHISHHRIENLIDDLFGATSTVSAQVDRFLSKFASGRSFGLPVGSQCSRVLAELLLSSIDRRLGEARIVWRRYVDDFVLLMPNQAEAYRALVILSNALADYGLTLNRTKTTFLTSKHYVDYVKAQLRSGDSEANKLLEIDLHFDPYSDTAESDYDELKEIVESLDIHALLNSELHKSQPDTFLMTQIGRTLKLHNPEAALQLCTTLLSSKNLHAFRASWSTILRGVSAVCADDRFASIFDGLDRLLDDVPIHSPHLLSAEVSRLHYLRAIRFRRTQNRAEFVFHTYETVAAQTVRRACIDCWRLWKDRTSFIRERNRWDSLKPEEQRMVWLAAAEFGDEGERFRRQVKQSLANAWRLGIERNNTSTFMSLYSDWSGDGH
jgi:hypothetical protein